MRSSAAIGLAVCALVQLAIAVESIPVSGHQGAPAGASQIVTNGNQPRDYDSADLELTDLVTGIESHIPPRHIITSAPDSDHEISLMRKLKPKSVRVSPVGTASDNVKALAHVSINMLADFAATNQVVGFLLGNESTAALSNFVYDASSADSLEPSFAMSSGRRKIVGVGAALFAITLFFAIYM